MTEIICVYMDGWIPLRREELKNLYLRICCLYNSECFLTIFFFKSHKFKSFEKGYNAS